MNSKTADITHIIKSAVTGEPSGIAGHLSAEEFFSLAQKHKAVSLMYHGAAGCGMEIRAELKASIQQMMIRELMVSGRQQFFIQKISEAFQENGIDFMLLKGSVMKPLYPKPEMRRMGDIDILIKESQYNKVQSVMEQLGFVFQNETGHELIWCQDVVMVELHKILVPSYNRELHSYLGDGWKRAVVENGSRHTFLPNDMFVYLFTHFAKHFRDTGIGINHMCDLYIYRKTHREELDFSYIEKELKKLHLDVFWQNVQKTLEVWFENGEPTPMADYITEVILNSGVYGVQELATVSEALRNSVNYGTNRSGRLHKIFRMVFPALASLKTKYPVLKKYPYLYPFVWAWRTASWPFTHKRGVTEKLGEMKSVDEEKLLARKQALAYVGLQYYKETDE